MRDPYEVHLIFRLKLRLVLPNRITNTGLLVKASVVLAFTVLLFFLQNIPQLNLSLGWTALLGAITLLILADTAEVEAIFFKS